MLQCETDFFTAFKFWLTVQLFTALKAKQKSELNYRKNLFIKEYFCLWSMLKYYVVTQVATLH